MPKMKTHKASRKRFRITATGKLKRHKAGKKHLLSHKSGKRKRHLRHGGGGRSHCQEVHAQHGRLTAGSRLLTAEKGPRTDDTRS